MMCKRLIVLIAFTSGITFSYAQPTDSSSYFYRKGIEERNGRRFREAEKNFVKASELSPGNIEIILDLANVLLAQNRYTEAWQKLIAAEKIDSNNSVIIENLATLSFNLHKWEDAIKYSGKMQLAGVKKPVSYIQGKSYYELENYGEAIKDLLVGMDEESQKAEIPYIIARSYLEMSNYRQSSVYMEKAIALDSSHADWMYECGLVYYAIPEYKKSLQFIELAGKKGYSKNNDYLNNLGNAYLNVGQNEKGIEVLKELLIKKPSDQEILYQVAQGYYKTGKFQDAIDYWDRAFAIDKSNARVLYMIGMSYQKKGEKQKGIQLCDKAIEMDPSLESFREKQGDIM